MGTTKCPPQHILFISVVSPRVRELGITKLGYAEAVAGGMRVLDAVGRLTPRSLFPYALEQDLTSPCSDLGFVAWFVQLVHGH